MNVILSTDLIETLLKVAEAILDALDEDWCKRTLKTERHKNNYKEDVTMDDKTVQLISKGLNIVARAIVIAIKTKSKQK